MRLDIFIKRYKPIKINYEGPESDDSWWNYSVENYHTDEDKKEISKLYGKYFANTMINEDGLFLVVSGYRFVNRVGYVFTQKPIKYYVRIGR